jgi:Flp pilus assembly protein TadD
VRAAPWWFAVLVCAAVLAVYANALRDGFVWDDGNIIVSNPMVRHWTEAARLFTSSLERNTQYYRPVLGLSFLVDYQLFGLSPAGFHLTSILIHAAVGVLLYLLAARLLGDSLAALFAALLFVVHPVHTEAVTYVSGRSDPLAALFTLAAVLWFLEPGRFALSLGAFLLALFSRETAMGLVLLIVLVDVTVALRRGEQLRGTWGRRIVRRYVPYVGVLLLYLVLRWLAVGNETVTQDTAAFSLATRLLTLPNVVVRYLGLLAVPAQLHMERVVPPAVSILDGTVLGSAAVLALIATAVVLWRRKAWPVTFGCAWFAVALLPVANLVPLATFMAEHWLYIPSMGLFIAAGWGLARLVMRAGLAVGIVALAVLVLAYGARTVRRNADWRDERTFYEATLHLAPDSARVHSNLGRVYWLGGDPERAKQEFARAIQLRPNHWQTADAHNHLGVIDQQEGRHPEAVEEFLRAIELYPRNPSPYVNLATSLQELGRVDEARRALESAIVLDGRFAMAYNNLGNISFKAGDLPRAREHYLKALALDPELGDAHNNLGSVYYSEGRFDLAAQSFRTALRLNPDSPMVRRNLESAIRALTAGQSR